MEEHILRFDIFNLNAIVIWMSMYWGLTGHICIIISLRKFLHLHSECLALLLYLLPPGTHCNAIDHTQSCLWCQVICEFLFLSQFVDFAHPQIELWYPDKHWPIATTQIAYCHKFLEPAGSDLYLHFYIWFGNGDFPVVCSLCCCTIICMKNIHETYVQECSTSL